MAELQRAKHAAVRDGHFLRFEVVSSSSYKLHADIDSDGIEDAREPVTVTRLSADYPEVRLSMTRPVAFAPDGSALTYSTITVSRGSERGEIEISSSTGIVAR
jgi:hypothetical protein